MIFIDCMCREPTSSGGSCSSAETGEGDKARVTRKAGHKRRRRANTLSEVSTQRGGGKGMERRRVTSYHEPSNKYTTSESSSNEEQAKSQSQEQIVNTCRKHSGVSEKDIGYTLLEGDTRLLRENVPDKPAIRSNDDPLSLLPPPCTCPYFGDSDASKKTSRPTTEVVIITTKDDHLTPSALLTKPPFSRRHPNFTSNRLNDSESLSSPETRSISSSLKSPAAISRGRPRSSVTSESSGTVVTWESPRRQGRGSSTVRTMRLSKELPTLSPKAPILRRSATLRVPACPPPDHNLGTVLLRYGSARGGAVRTHHSRNSSVMSRTSSRHGRIIRLEQKATKVLGVVFFTFVILWAPFFVLNLLPSICAECEHQIDQGVFDFVTWLGYASSMVNPIFYTIFNKVFRQTFKKVLLCKYHRNKSWKPPR